MKRHHAIIEPEVGSFGDGFTMTARLVENGQIFQMRIDEIPHALIRSGGEPEAFFQSTVGPVGGDHQILLGTVLVTCR